MSGIEVQPGEIVKGDIPLAAQQVVSVEERSGVSNVLLDERIVLVEEIVAAVAGLLNPQLAAVGMAASSVIVTSNSQRSVC